MARNTPQNSPISTWQIVSHHIFLTLIILFYRFLLIIRMVWLQKHKKNTFIVRLALKQHFNLLLTSVIGIPIPILLSCSHFWNTFWDFLKSCIKHFFNFKAYFSCLREWPLETCREYSLFIYFVAFTVAPSTSCLSHSCSIISLLACFLGCLCAPDTWKYVNLQSPHGMTSKRTVWVGGRREKEEIHGKHNVDHWVLYEVVKNK